MSSNLRTESHIETSVLASLRAGVSKSQAARDFNIDESTVRRISKRSEWANPSPLVASDIVYSDKKIGGFNWRDALPAIEALQKLRGEASWSQKTAEIRVGDGSCPVAIVAFGDQHIGAMSTDYQLFLEVTDLILNTPNLYVALMGDETEMAIKLRSVAEVCAQILDPFMQAEFIESWLNEISHKVLFSVWSNHSTEREEKASGNSIIKSILARKVPFFSGIGHVDLLVGEQTYKLAVSHKFKGVTAVDASAGCKRYLRVEYTAAEIAIQGDCHRASVSLYNEGNRHLLAITSGTLNVNSGFAQRYFSLSTSTAFPVVLLRPDKHQFDAFFTVQQYLDIVKPK
jgi:hypothetical protein